jgi:sorbose reductase
MLFKQPGIALTYGVAQRNFSISKINRQDLSDVKITDRMSLKDRNFLITGGGRGIGFAICKAITQLRGNVAVIDALSEPVEEFHTLGDKFGTKTFYQKADVTDQQSLESAFSSAVKSIGPLQGCVPAAGIALDKPLADHGWDESLKVLMVNTMGTFWTVKLVADHMREHGQGGSIVMIASVAAQGIKAS